MINNLPDDIINLILNKLEDNKPYTKNIPYLRMNVIYILSLRNINKFFKGYIEKQKNLWHPIDHRKTNMKIEYAGTTVDSNLILDKRSKEADTLCLKNTSLQTFNWLFENNIHLSIKNIQNLIIKNRVDVIQQGFHYEEFLKILFNRFHLCSSNDILSLSKNISPMSTAVHYDRVDIIKLLLESSTHGNPYLDQIDSIFEDSIKYTNTATLNFLLVNYYDKLKETINKKLNTIILRFNNIEDILFYIVITKKAIVTREIIKSIITKNYIDLFKYCYEEPHDPNYIGWKSKNNSDLLLKCLESNSFIIFEYLMDNGSYINPIEFSEVFLSKKKHNTLFLNTILDKYPDLLPLNTGIISLSIKNNCIGR